MDTDRGADVSQTSQGEHSTDQSAARNGSHDGAAVGSANGQHTPPPQVARAEEMVDRFADGVANFTSVWGRRLFRAAARVREEAQDLWAEAQSIRRGDQP